MHFENVCINFLICSDDSISSHLHLFNVNCIFYHKTFFYTHFGNKKDSNLLVEGENEDVLCTLSPFEM